LAARNIAVIRIAQVLKESGLPLNAMAGAFGRLAMKPVMETANGEGVLVCD